MTRKNSAFAALTLGAAAAILATGPSTAQTRPEEARAAREVFGWKKSGDQWVQGRFRVDGAPVGGARAVRSRAAARPAEARGSTRVRAEAPARRPALARPARPAPVMTAVPARTAAPPAPPPAALARIAPTPPQRALPAPEAPPPRPAALATAPLEAAPVVARPDLPAAAVVPVAPLPPADDGVQTTSSIASSGAERMRGALEARARVMAAEHTLLSLPVPDPAGPVAVPVR